VINRLAERETLMAMWKSRATDVAEEAEDAPEEDEEEQEPPDWSSVRCTLLQFAAFLMTLTV
jgi:hypothetical protein